MWCPPVLKAIKKHHIRIERTTKITKIANFLRALSATWQRPISNLVKNRFSEECFDRLSFFWTSNSHIHATKTSRCPMVFISITTISNEVIQVLFDLFFLSKLNRCLTTDWDDSCCRYGSLLETNSWKKFSIFGTIHDFWSRNLE